MEHSNIKAWKICCISLLSTATVAVSPAVSLYSGSREALELLSAFNPMITAASFPVLLWAAIVHQYGTGEMGGDVD